MATPETKARLAALLNPHGTFDDFEGMVRQLRGGHVGLIVMSVDDAARLLADMFFDGADVERVPGKDALAFVPKIAEPR